MQLLMHKRRPRRSGSLLCCHHPCAAGRLRVRGQGFRAWVNRVLGMVKEMTGTLHAASTVLGAGVGEWGSGVEGRLEGSGWGLGF